MISLENVLHVPPEVPEAIFDPDGSRGTILLILKCPLSPVNVVVTQMCILVHFSTDIWYFYPRKTERGLSCLFLSLSLVWSCWWGWFDPHNTWKSCLCGVLHSTHGFVAHCSTCTCLLRSQPVIPGGKLLGSLLAENLRATDAFWLPFFSLGSLQSGYKVFVREAQLSSLSRYLRHFK